MIGDRQGLLDVLLHEQDRRARRRSCRGKCGIDLLDQIGRKTDGGLVDQQQLRCRHQLARHREHAALTARERAGALGPLVFQDRKQRIEALELAGDARPVTPEGPGAHQQVFFNLSNGKLLISWVM